VALRPPLSGFREFLIHRSAWSAHCELVFFTEPLLPFLERVIHLPPEGRDEASNLARTYLLEFPKELHTWLQSIGLSKLVLEKVADCVANFRLLHYDFERHYIRIPDFQDHPFEPRALLPGGNVSSVGGQYADVIDALYARKSRTPWAPPPSKTLP
jgi:hypothetical protein